MSTVAFTRDSSKDAPFIKDDRFIAFSDEFGDLPPVRLLIFADRHGATQEISFLCALARWRGKGAAAIRVLDEPGLTALRARDGATRLTRFLRRQFIECRPTAVVLSRFCGPEYPLIFELAEDAQVPVICHLDDNLIDPPILLGAEIWRRLKQPRRIHALYEIIERADLVYLSTPRLAEAIGRNCAASRLIAGAIYVGAGSGELRLTAKLAGVPKRRPGEIRIGYMGSASHASDLEMIAPAIEQVIAQFAEVTFHLFGSIAATGVASRFTDRTLLLARVKGDYVDFRKVLALLDWDIGLAPLRPIEFNECKAPTKCIEYLDAGIAPIASNSRVYQPLAKAGAVLLADADDWVNSMTSLITEPQRREAFLSAGRAVLVRDFGWERLERQVIDLLALASASLENAA